MTDTPITSLDDAKAALDAEISSIQSIVDYHAEQVRKAKAELEEYRSALWRFRRLRRRMEPAEDTPAMKAEAA